jgi:hypothetical protein
MTVIKYKDALQEFQNSLNQDEYKTDKLNFVGVGDRDVYNITAPFLSAGIKVIAGRVEARDSEQSEIVFFEEKDGTWAPIDGSMSFQLQDPFFTMIKGELVIGGVEIYPRPGGTEGQLSWRTIFYKGTDIYHLKPLFKGPDAMKDLRLVELADGKIGIFTRPQGEKGGRGKIGFAKVDHLKDLSIEVIESAQLLKQFTDDEWGGANEIHLLKNGLLGVLAHHASFSANDTVRHYASAAFTFNPDTLAYSKMKMIAHRGLFNEGVAKRSDLQDVVFSGGLQRHENGRATMYAGVGDAEAHWLEMDDPFVEWEGHA